MAQAFNPSVQEGKADQFLWVQASPFCIVSSRTARITYWDSVSKKPQNQAKTNQKTWNKTVNHSKQNRGKGITRLMKTDFILKHLSKFLWCDSTNLKLFSWGLFVLSIPSVSFYCLERHTGKEKSQLRFAYRSRQQTTERRAVRTKGPVQGHRQKPGELNYSAISEFTRVSFRTRWSRGVNQ